MKHIKFIVLVSLLHCISVYAQYTQIPDPAFEQALIYLEIDSEGVLDGQVLTSDIEDVEELDLRYAVQTINDIYNLIGLEDFISLKVLGIQSVDLYFNELDLSITPHLEEFYLTGGVDATGPLSEINLTNNPNIKVIDLEDDWGVLSIDLRGGDMELDSLSISYSPGSFPWKPMPNRGHNTSKLCVKVTDPIAATNKTGVYTNWIDYNTVYYVTDDCSLSVKDYDLASFKIYPNPSQYFFQVDASIGNTSLILYDISGKEVKIYKQIQDVYDISNLSAGIYILKIKFETGDILTKKLVKE